jgi:RHS repeat-associated protein
MVKEGVEWFGAYTTNVAVNVTSAAPSAQLEIDPATNRAYAPNDSAHTRMSYDAAGNLINDTYTGYGIRTYDAENRMASSYDIGNALSSYHYDADGHRVRRITGGLEWWQIYGMDGEVVAEYLAGAAPTAPQKEYGYRKEQLLIVASPSANVQWLVTDHLGTPRMVVDLTGNLAGVKRHDYLPFGEEIFAGTGGRTMQQGYYADGVRQKFTGQERDAETGLDYFINRYYSSTMGRFTSPDPVSLTSQRKTDPQRLNLYAYARNNPVLLTDPNGLELYVYGTDAEVARFLSDLERITGLKFDYDKSTGRVTIAKNSPKPKNAEAVRIAGIIGDLSNRVEAYVMKGDDPKYTQRGVLVANTNSTGQTIIDYEDVDKNSPTSKGTRPLNIIYHEIVEAYEYLTNKAAKAALAAGDKKKAYEIVHQAAIDAENVYRKRVGIPARGAATTEGPVVDAKGDLIISATGDARYKIDYTTHIEYWTSNVNSQSKISSIQVVAKKP